MPYELNKVDNFSNKQISNDILKGHFYSYHPLHEKDKWSLSLYFFFNKN